MAERKHQPLNRDDAMRLAFLNQRAPGSPEARALQSRYDAERRFLDLSAVEEVAARAPTQQLDPRQLAADAQRMGLAGTKSKSRPYDAPAPAVAEAGARISALRENQDAAALLARAQREYDGACSAAAARAAGLAAANHRAAIDAKSRELQFVVTKQSETPANGEFAAEIRKLQGEIERLVQTPPK